MHTPTISTKSGRNISLLSPSPAQITIDDIAQGLANQCRFNGQTNAFYSVAQHSVLVATILPDELKLAGLLHDASEAYLGDIVQPLKELIPAYSEFESKFTEAIAKRFNVDFSNYEKIKEADLIALATERRDLMPMEKLEWTVLNGISPLPNSITPLSPSKAQKQFIECFFKLTHSRKHESKFMNNTFLNSMNNISSRFHFLLG